jgi:hypothetical protein
MYKQYKQKCKKYIKKLKLNGDLLKKYNINNNDIDENYICNDDKSILLHDVAEVTDPEFIDNENMERILVKKLSYQNKKIPFNFII